MTRTTTAERTLAAGGSVELAKVRTGDRVFVLQIGDREEA